MGIMAICFVCGLVYDIYVRVRKKQYDRELAPMCLIATFLSAIVALFVLIVMWSFNIGTEYKVVSEYQLKALNDIQQTNVSVSFIGRSNDDAGLVYVAAIDTSRGVKLERYDIDKSYIVEDDSTPRIVEERKCFTNDIMKYLLFPKKGGNSAIYTFYIPEGSVVTEYSIDLN